MKSLWNDEEAAGYPGDLGQRVYTSRLLGRDKSLVLHGGGNTSVKIREKNLLGDEVDILYVKGSGWDLETIEAPGFSPVHLDHLIRLADLPQLSDLDMVNELRAHMTLASAPTPSVEAILHATLPFKYVDHTHADAIVTITNTAKGLERIKEIYGDDVVIIPYIMPGFDLARDCAARFADEAGPNTLGMVLMNHGIFSFGDNARESYERMIALVDRAEEYIKHNKAWQIAYQPKAADTDSRRLQIARLRQAASKEAGFPMVMSRHIDERSMNFVARPDLAKIATQGPATPDHVIRTKQLPLIGTDTATYAHQYHAYFAKHAPHSKVERTMLDPAPRLALDPELGLCTMGRTAKDADIVYDIYQHTMDIILRAEALGGWQALPSSDIFEMEYWDLEQAKLKKGGKPPMFTGEVALVTGAASGIGKACCESLMAQGAAVVGLDLSPSIKETFKSQSFLGIQCDITDEAALEQAVEGAVTHFGGIDMLILNAGMFPGGCQIADLPTDQWRKVFSVNLDANLTLMQLVHPLFQCSPNGGRVVVIGSRNVPAPGPGAAAYSASKAALTQLSRIAALEWGSEGIRINLLHPDAVFDTGIWSEEVLTSRAKHYSMTVENYKTRNVLKTEVASSDVANLAAAMCGPLFACTTGAQVPIDGGNDRVI